MLVPLYVLELSLIVCILKRSIFGLSAEKLNVLITTSLAFEDILASPLVLVGIFDEYN